MKKNICKILTGACVLAWMIMIFSFSAQPAKESSEVSGTIAYRIVTIADKVLGADLTEQQKAAYAAQINHPIRKAAHMTEYAILSIFLFLFLRCCDKKKVVCCCLSAVLSSLYALSDEIHQYFVPGRACQAQDVLIDSAGVVLAMVFIYFLTRIIRKHKMKNGY